MTNLHEGQTATIAATGEKVRILGLDSDPSALVWVTFAADPDRDAFLPRAALTA